MCCLCCLDKSDAKAAFVRIFTERCGSYCAAVANAFQQVSQEYTMVSAIHEAFGDSDTARGLQLLVQFVTQTYDFWAKKVFCIFNL